MEALKSKVIAKLTQEIEGLDFSTEMEQLELKYNTITETLWEYISIQKEKLEIPFSQTTNNNIYGDEFGLDGGKSLETILNESSYNSTNHSLVTPSSSIPQSFSLSYEMRQFAKSKYIQNVEETFENFKLYYQSKGTINNDWEAVWKRWVLNQNRYTNHLVKTTIDEELKLDETYIKIAKKYLKKELIDLEFIKFKNHYISNGDLKVSWEKVWENWCINSKQFQPKEQSAKSKEKQDYKWSFRKAKEVSDKIKDWLEFEKGINWLDDFYWQNRPIPGIGWQKVIHPDFNKEEILLFKIDSVDGKFLIQYQNDEVIDAEVLEHD